MTSSVLLLNLMTIATAEDSHKGRDMTAMEETSKSNSETFKHENVVDGVRAEFQIMSLASMNLTDESGATHHVMVKFFNEDGNHQIHEAVGKIKVVSPGNKEQIKKLDNYNGIFAANFMFMEKGRYGVICLIKVNGEKKLFMFWYPHP